MARACVLLAHGFEEIEAVTVIDVLRRAGVEVVVLGVDAAVAQGAHGIAVTVDLPLSEAVGPWDAVVLPGGMPGAGRLRDSRSVQAFLAAQADAGATVAAICAAPIALAAAGLLVGRQATCFPGFEGELRGARPSQAEIVEDGPVVTSRGPGTAFAFALTLVARLVSPAAAEEQRRKMLVSPPGAPR